jgi:hypothetical protein
MQCNQVDTLMNSVKVVLGYSANGSVEIAQAQAHVHITWHRNWEIKKALGQALAQMK